MCSDISRLSFSRLRLFKSGFILSKFIRGSVLQFSCGRAATPSGVFSREGQTPGQAAPENRKSVISNPIINSGGKYSENFRGIIPHLPGSYSTTALHTGRTMPRNRVRTTLREHAARRRTSPTVPENTFLIPKLHFPFGLHTFFRIFVSESQNPNRYAPP